MNKTITLNLDVIQADLLRCVIEAEMADLRFSDYEEDAVLLYRLNEIYKDIDSQMK